MANYILVPVDSLAQIDGVPAYGVNFTGIDPEIHMVSWYGTRGFIEFKYDPETDSKPNNQEITSFLSFQSYVDEAEEIIFAQNNPVCFWCTEAGAFYEGSTYNVGDEIRDCHCPSPTAPPLGFTSQDPGVSPGEWTTVQWTGSGWVYSSFPCSYSLTQAQEYLTSQVNTNASVLVNNQLRDYNFLQISTCPTPLDLLPADSVENLYPTIGDYQAAVEAEVTPLLAEIQAAVDVESLYSFNPTVDEPAPFVSTTELTSQ